MNKSIEFFEGEKKTFRKQLEIRLEEIDKYYFDLEHNWRVSEAKRLIEEIQLMTNAIESIKQMQKGCNDDTKIQSEDRIMIKPITEELLKNLESVRERTKKDLEISKTDEWIPVTERLPKNGYC